MCRAPIVVDLSSKPSAGVTSTVRRERHGLAQSLVAPGSSGGGNSGGTLRCTRANLSQQAVTLDRRFPGRRWGGHHLANNGTVACRAARATGRRGKSTGRKFEHFRAVGGAVTARRS